MRLWTPPNQPEKETVERAILADKAPDAFRTISEVAEDMDLPQHVLRFWETKFSQIRPLKRGGGRRYYRPDDVDLLRGIKHLLYGEGYTIKGVQRILKASGLKAVQNIGRDPHAAHAVEAAPSMDELDDKDDFISFTADQNENAPAPVEEAEEQGDAAFFAPQLPPIPVLMAKEAHANAPQPLALHAIEEAPSFALPDLVVYPPSSMRSDNEAAGEPVYPVLPVLTGQGLDRTQTRLSKEDKRHLQASLVELMECQRLLESVRTV